MKDLSNKLLTTNDEQIYVTQLESLVQKVFKEEWVKTMLARGTDPDVVMEKIDKHWEKWKKKNVPNQDNQRINKQESQPDSQNNNKSTNKGSYIGYNDNNKSDLNKGNNRISEIRQFS